jgi:hypothetical protein
VALYKCLLNALPLLTPFRSTQLIPPPAYTASVGEQKTEDADLEQGTTRDTRRLSVQGQKHQEWVRKHTKRWHAIFAGAVAGGLGLLFEKRQRRVPIAQQFFVR